MHCSYMDICLLILTYWSNTEHRHHAYPKHIQTYGIQDDVLHMQNKSRNYNREQETEPQSVHLSCFVCHFEINMHQANKHDCFIPFGLKQEYGVPPYTTTSSGLKQHIYSQSAGWDKYQLKPTRTGEPGISSSRKIMVHSQLKFRKISPHVSVYMQE